MFRVSVPPIGIPTISSSVVDDATRTYDTKDPKPPHTLERCSIECRKAVDKERSSCCCCLALQTSPQMDQNRVGHVGKAPSCPEVPPESARMFPSPRQQVSRAQSVLGTSTIIDMYSTYDETAVRRDAANTLIHKTHRPHSLIYD